VRAVGRWLGIGAVVVWGAWIVATQIAGREVPTWWAAMPTAAFVVLAVARGVREATRARSGAIRRTVGPGVQGLGEVQDIQLGRPTGLTVTYGSEPTSSTELVVDNVDPLAGSAGVTSEADGP
jgi:hypothetical protein